VALVAAVTGTVGSWSPGTVQPAAIARPTAVAHQALLPGAAFPPSRSVRNQPAQLDAFLAVAASASADRAQAASSDSRKAVRLTPRQVAIELLRRFRWSKRQFRYLDLLWSRESSWNVRAFNPYSGAYGIPQAVPGAKMASAGPRWRTSARTQILWGLDYIKERYGSPEAAWDHELSTGWY
jgi:hypothetical protein